MVLLPLMLPKYLEPLPVLDGQKLRLGPGGGNEGVELH